MFVHEERARIEASPAKMDVADPDRQAAAAQEVDQASKAWASVQGHTKPTDQELSEEFIEKIGSTDEASLGPLRMAHLVAAWERGSKSMRAEALGSISVKEVLHTLAVGHKTPLDSVAAVASSWAMVCPPSLSALPISSVR